MILKLSQCHPHLLSSAKDKRPFLQNREEQWNQSSDTDDNPEANALSEGEESASSFSEDPFKPFDGLPHERSMQLTVRAVLLGVFCGTLVNASNIYIGLKAGWTASANIFAVLTCTEYLREYTY